MFKVRLSARKKVDKRSPLARSLWMEREICVLGDDGIFGFEFADAPGAQIAPRSHEVRKNLQDYRIGHGLKLPSDHEVVARPSGKLMLVQRSLVDRKTLGQPRNEAIADGIYPPQRYGVIDPQHVADWHLSGHNFTPSGSSPS